MGREEIGAYAETIRPIAERFELTGKMGLDVRTSPDAAIAIAQTLMLLCRYIDLMHAERHLARSLRRLGWQLLGFTALIVLLALAG